MRIPKLNFLVLFLLSACLTTAAIAQKTNLTSRDFKKLAGAAEEIPQMRLPNPADLGLKSKTAMLPVAASRGVQKFEIPIENAADFRLMLLAPTTEKWQIKVALPNEEFINLRSGAAGKNIELTKDFYGLGDEQIPAEVFTFKSGAATGVLRVEINTQRSESGGFLVAASESPLRLYSYVNTLETVRGNNIGLLASIFDNNDEAAFAGAIREASAKIESPNGEFITTKMFDDGNHGDKLAGDGIFGGSFFPNQTGKYVVQVVVRGTNPNGEAFIRTSEHLIDVAAARAVFDENALVKAIDETRLQIDLTAENLRAGQKVIAHAEVWGRDANGNEKAVAWIGGMTLAEKSFGRNRAILPLTLDTRWLARSDAQSDFQLRNVRVQDADSFVLLGTKEIVSLPIALPENLQRTFNGEISDEMRMGVSPAQAIQPEAAGGKLMLVHGYCSSDVWGAAASAGQFTNYVKFLDLNQNRSHDQFAQRIRNFGANLPSFGIVAHSQGGAASLHLYTYYWSGLDYATGSRLIQSVGTPYQGTALAGNLAAIGSVFGAGCGTNNDMTYSGAAAWLANIPSWARAKVFYHTTSFTDVWYRYDYCSLATDLFLGDPEDGVVEQAYAQLPGATNLGHKTGWCHTSGMRDPAQTTDSSRNSNMNSYAAR